jgi:DNA-binding transcriptional MerR regulator
VGAINQYIADATGQQASCKAKLANLGAMQISELAQRTGVSVHALRHYERLGMLLPARRSSGYREYTEAMRREVIFIAMSRKVGFSLQAIAVQLPAYRAGRLSTDQMVESLQARVAEIEQQTERLKSQRSEVISHIAWLKKQQQERQVQKTQRLTALRDGPLKAPWPTVKATALPQSKPHSSTATRKKTKP